MYIPDHFRMRTEADMYDFIDRFDFGLLVSPSLQSTHMPLLLERSEGPHGALFGHVARGNPHWNELEGAKVLAVFTGPHGYISPTWYQSKPAVPTWNYASVHVYGTASLLPDEQTAATIDSMLSRYEPALLTDSDVLTDEHKHKLLAGIKGFKVEIDRLEGKAKLSQNRSKDDREGVIRHLTDSGNGVSLALADIMGQYRDN